MIFLPFSNFSAILIELKQKNLKERSKNRIFLPIKRNFEIYVSPYLNARFLIVIRKFDKNVTWKAITSNKFKCLKVNLIKIIYKTHQVQTNSTNDFFVLTFDCFSSFSQIIHQKGKNFHQKDFQFSLFNREKKKKEGKELKIESLSLRIGENVIYKGCTHMNMYLFFWLKRN